MAKKSEKELVRYIDPPMGWNYGFPKEIPEHILDIKDWLVKNGYPKWLIDHHGEQFIYRIGYSEKKKNN